MSNSKLVTGKETFKIFLLEVGAFKHDGKEYKIYFSDNSLILQEKGQMNYVDICVTDELHEAIELLNKDSKE